MTSLAEEQAEQQRWQLQARYRRSTWFDKLVAGEFQNEKSLTALTDQRLSEVLRYALASVPHYRELAARHKLQYKNFQKFQDLQQLPVLNKQDIIGHEGRFMSSSLPRGVKAAGWVASSGTTGKPCRVRQTNRDQLMFALLMQRFTRWCRWDPMGKVAAIRNASTLPPQPDGTALAKGETQRLASWHYLGDLFKTGPQVAFDRQNPFEDQLAWLEAERPDYLVTYPSALEAMVLAKNGPPVASLKGYRVISAHLTAGMQRRINALCDLTIEQNYGLNEIGVVANKCDEGRYHVNSEHCIVEIVDGEGLQCAPGQPGRIVVTSLTNLAMPLIRYDTSDMAQLVQGPCPCGRTLPAFEQIMGKIRTWRGTPDGTVERVSLIEAEIEAMEVGTLRNLVDFQIYQKRDKSIDLRLMVRGALQPQFGKTLTSAWARAFPDDAPLALVEVDDIPAGPGGKRQSLDSEFFDKSEWS